MLKGPVFLSVTVLLIPRIPELPRKLLLHLRSVNFSNVMLWQFSPALYHLTQMEIPFSVDPEFI